MNRPKAIEQAAEHFQRCQPVPALQLMSRYDLSVGEVLARIHASKPETVYVGDHVRCERCRWMLEGASKTHDPSCVHHYPQPMHRDKPRAGR